MKYKDCVIFFIFVGLSLFLKAEDLSVHPSVDLHRLSADSLMSKVISFAPLYENIIGEYRASVYVKGRVNVRKKNYLLRYVPSMFRLKRGVRDYMIEMSSDLHFSAPNIYDQKINAVAGTSSKFWKLDGRLPDYFHINLYSPALLYDKLLSPLSPNAKKYYKYSVDSIIYSKHDLRYRIKFTPKIKSFQLVTGYMIVSDEVWSIREIYFRGRSEILRINLLMQMGEIGEADEFLPVLYKADGTFRFIGNVLDCKYTALINYKEIQKKRPIDPRAKPLKSKYDLTSSYTLHCDTNASRVDSAYFNKIRPLPLSESEKKLYQDYFMREDTLLHFKKKMKHAYSFWGELGDVLTSRYTLDLAKSGSVRFSPIINPFMLSFGGSNGLSYRQDFKYTALLSRDRLLRIAPKVGYNFKRKEVYWSINSDFDYWPRKRSSLHLNVGNGNRIYSSDILDELKNIPDSVFDFNQIHLDYFKDLYIKVRHSWEITNGLTLDVGLFMHKRTEVNRSNFDSLRVITRTEDPSEEVMDKFRHTYRSFAPHVQVAWTPGQYYYMNGKRKINLNSKYPTFAVDWERGIKGILSASGQYESIEFDMQHHISVGLLRDFYYRFGWGAFTDQKELFFVDFTNFSRSNLPIGWNDEIGGVFQLLDARWYNSSRKYLRGHMVYESPFLMLHHLFKSSPNIMSERLYLNALVVPHLNPYLEVGYGIGTHIFDFGVFASFANWKYREIGCKFTFELFSR